MKKAYSVLLTSLLIIGLSAQVAVPVDLEKSRINWEGSNLFQLGGHYGTVNFKSGELLFKNEELVGGTFVADMNSIINTDKEFIQDLVDHLKNEDFFDVEKFPTATLTLTKVEIQPDNTFLLNADFEIKGITHPVTIHQAEKVNATTYRAVFIIDRAKWSIKYGSRSFFDDLGDNIISDAIKLDVVLHLEAQ